MDKLIQLFILLFPTIIQLVQQAEVLFTGAKKGQVKKEYVLNVLGLSLDAMDIFKDTVSEYKSLVLSIAGQLIDFIVSTYNATSFWGKTAQSDIKSGDVIPF